VIGCPVCRTENREDARFCNNCGTRLAAPTAVAEERKVITALFCDLVGFTATSEGADPEDVDRMLSRYAATARAQIEAHGGVVEKFNGDAVVGVFGVPAAHEDDPERAVRAALRIVAETERLPALRGAPLRLRIGINTGEAFVRLEVAPGTGDRFLAGDTVNTASRIQSVAPEMGVAVGLPTYEATKRRFEYVELPPATLKGKAEPVRVFHPVAPLERPGTDQSTVGATRFVGRAAELAALARQLDDAIATRSLRFATVVGEPGLGKSRLVAELLTHTRGQAILVTWRQGRCLPYGNGISFWALGEIVKAQAGILESDSATAAEAKLERSLPDVPERAWLHERLLPLIGVGTDSRAEREEQFSAWRRFLELIAEDRPAVVVFEDLHWADDTMLQFLEDLVERAPAAALLVLGTTRPDLFDRRPGFPGGETATVTRLDLAPLTPGDAGELAASLLDATPLTSELRTPLLDRANGNPLFVEEYVRLLVDRDLLVRTDAGLAMREGAALPVPDSIHAVLAARLDALPGEWKAVLGDASIIGSVFWDGAVVAIGQRDRRVVAEALDGLARREFVRRSEASSMAGEVELAFWHVLARDVAYGTLPRSVRAAKHVAAATWIEAKAAGRLGDVADVLAQHYSTALELARAAGSEDEGRELVQRAFDYLTLAGERAMALDMAAALGFLGRALELAPPGDPSRPDALNRYGFALSEAGRFAEAKDVLQEAIDGYFAADRPLDAGNAMLAISDPLRFLGQMGRTAEAIALLEPLGPSIPLVRALVRMTSNDIISGEFRRCLERVDRILELTAELEGQPGVRATDVDRIRTAAKAAKGEARARLGRDRWRRAARGGRDRVRGAGRRHTRGSGIQQPVGLAERDRGARRRDGGRQASQ
jgi:class 3 adenylate cyclase/tetratricopeptide (TPR) repeat protein